MTNLSRQRQARLHTVGFGLADGQRPDSQPVSGVWPNASLFCGLQVTRGRIDGEVGYMVEKKEKKIIVRNP